VSILLDFLYPRFCVKCGAPGSNLCPACTATFSPLALSSSPPPPLAGLLSLLPYTSPVPELLKNLKFNFNQDLAPAVTGLLAGLLKQHFPNLVSYWQEHDYCIVPVPLHPRRQAWRGFNQSELIGFGLARSLRLSFNSSCLRRCRFSSPQSTLPSAPKVRNANIAGSFALAAPPPAHLILFDDVSTTGSTLVCAALAFPKTSQIWGLTVAA